MKIEMTDKTPEVELCTKSYAYSIKGESFPENVKDFYAPVLEYIERDLKTSCGNTINLNLQLIYFNSSTARILCTLLEMFDDAASNNIVNINWIYRRNDDNIEEMGSDFQEIVSTAFFNMVEVNG